MSKNDKIKVDPNSFDKMTAKVKPSAPKKDPNKISDNKLIAWFQRYWYYYKVPAFIGAFALLLVGIFVYEVATAKDPDMRFTFITESGVSDVQMLEISTKITDYIVDVNGDGEALISPQSLTLAENPTSDYEMAAYSQIMTMFIDADYTAFIIDDYVYDYMIRNEALEKLSYYGIESDEEYRLLLNDTILFKDTELNASGPYYLVFKVCNVDYVDDSVIQGMYDIYVKLAKDIVAAQ